MSDLENKLNDAVDTLTEYQKTINTAQKTANAASNIVKKGTKLVNTAAKPFNTGNGKTAVSSMPAVRAAGSTGEQVAPEGTCIIIPASVSSTGQPRYIGAEAYNSIVGMINGQETLANVVVVGADQQPSSLVYDKTPQGTFLKGTNVPIEIQMEGDGKLKGVILSEKEYESCVKGIQSTDQNVKKFSTSSELGKAENANLQSWWKRNLEIIIPALIFIVGGGILYFICRKQKKQTKSAQNQINTSTQTTEALKSEIKDLQQQNANSSNGSNNGNGNTLSDNSQSVSGDSSNSGDNSTFVQVNGGR